MISIELLVSIILIVIIMVMVGIFVYTDAKSRNMNAAFWAIIAVIAPVLLGLLIYIINRGDIGNLVCPKCNTPVDKSFKVCPKCGTTLKSICPSCNGNVEPEWKICPSCGGQLANDSVSPVMRKDNKLKLVFLLVLILTVLILFLLVGIINMKRISYDSNEYSEETVNTTPIINDISKGDLSGNKNISEWIDNCDSNQDGIYVLRYIGNDSTQYLLYRKGFSNKTVLDVRENVVSFTDTNTDNEYGYEIFFFETEYSDEMPFFNDGSDESMDIDQIDVQYDISRKSW